jgi:Mesyanzhinovviridae DNA primase
MVALMAPRNRKATNSAQPPRKARRRRSPRAGVIAELNAKHAVVRTGGKTRVITTEWDPVLERRVLTYSHFEDIRGYYCNRCVVIQSADGKDTQRALGDYWLEHGDRRQYEGVVFQPNTETPGYFNLWGGFGVEPKEGDCSLMKAHISEVICSANADLEDYLMAWMAAAVQHPEQAAEVAVVLRGRQGTGKGVFAREFGRLFGQHFVHVSNAKHLTGNFNAHLQDAVVVFADEAFGTGNRAAESTLKMLITEPTIPIEAKGRDIVMVKNVIHLILASNHEWIVPAGLDDRRFCVLDVSDKHARDHAYFAALIGQMQSGGDAAMLHDLMRFDYSDIDLRRPPVTEALREQKLMTMQPNFRWWYQKLYEGRLLSRHEQWETMVMREELHADYAATMKDMGSRQGATSTELGMFLRKVLPTGYPIDFQRNVSSRPNISRRKWHWEFPSLAMCRQQFDELTKSEHPWPDMLSDAQP